MPGLGAPDPCKKGKLLPHRIGPIVRPGSGRIAGVCMDDKIVLEVIPEGACLRRYRSSYLGGNTVDQTKSAEVRRYSRANSPCQ
jgi:hypothetical protein